MVTNVGNKILITIGAVFVLESSLNYAHMYSAKSCRTQFSCPVRSIEFSAWSKTLCPCFVVSIDAYIYFLANVLEVKSKRMINRNETYKGNPLGCFETQLRIIGLQAWIHLSVIGLDT